LFIQSNFVLDEVGGIVRMHSKRSYNSTPNRCSFIHFQCHLRMLMREFEECLTIWHSGELLVLARE